MSLSRCTVAIIGLGLFLIVSASTNAQAPRTWVSGVGDDVNPCSRTAPCKTFAGAISKTATNGEISCLDPAGYGSVTITKSITIDCTGTFASVFASLTNGVIINIAPSDARKAVRLRGLQINGISNGINGVRVVSDATNVSIENVVIDGFAGNGISVEGSSEVIVSNSSVRATSVAIFAATRATVRLTRNVITHNKTGLKADGGSIISFKDNVISGNGIDGSPTFTAQLQ